MKRIAIVTRKMITGGVERALIAMLKHFDYTTVEVDLYLEALGGELFHEIPNEVNCIQIPSIHGIKSIAHPVFAAKKLNAMWRLRSGNHSYIEQCYLSSQMLMPITKEYDIAISYHAPNTVPVFYVIDGMRAEKKILWLHSDLENNAGDTEIAIRYHGLYNQVFAVSPSAKESFLRYHPQMASCTEVFYNYVDADAIWTKAKNGPTFTDEFNGTRILSIGRLAFQKGFDMAVLACRKLIDRGYPVRWYICGEGEDRPKLEKMILDNHLEEVFFLLGNQPNPYHYLLECDLYVQPSRFEGYCITAHEARVLAKPVVITDVAGASDQFINGVTGWIVPINAEAIENQIAYCLEHTEEVYTVQKRLESTSFEQENNLASILE